MLGSAGRSSYWKMPDILVKYANQHQRSDFLSDLTSFKSDGEFKLVDVSFDLCSVDNMFLLADKIVKCYSV